MEQNSEALVIFKFWPKLHTRTLAEIIKLTNFKFVFFHCKAVKLCHNDQIRM